MLKSDFLKGLSARKILSFLKTKLIKLTIFVCVILLLGSFLYLGEGLLGVAYNKKTNYFEVSPKTTQALKPQLQYISKKLVAKKYGVSGGHWGILSAHAFYLYALGNMYLANPQDQAFLQFAQNEGKFVYKYIKGEGKDKFVQPTKIPNGIIYQGHKLHSLATLVILGLEEYRQELYTQSDFLAGYLKESPKYNGESYQDLARYIDNIDAYYGLYLTDLIRKKHGEPEKNQELLSSWLSEVKKDVDGKGLMLSEAYSRKPERNQARGISQAWMLVYLAEMDPEFFASQYRLFQEHFVDESLGMYFVRDVPRDEAPHFHLSSGPTLFGYSSSAQLMALAVYHTAGKTKPFEKTLRALDISLSYNPYLGNALPIWGPVGESVLINSLLLWGKTTLSWTESYMKIR